MIISGSCDILKIWDIEGKCLKTIDEKGSGYMYSLVQISEVEFAVGCNDGCIYIYDFIKGSRSRVLKGHSERCVCVQVLNRTTTPLIVSSADDQRLIIWTIHSTIPVKNFQLEFSISTFQITDLLPKGHVLFGSLDGSIGVYDIFSGQFASQIRKIGKKLIWNIQSRRDSRLLPSQILVFTSQESKIRVWTYDLNLLKFFSVGSINCDGTIFSTCLLPHNIVATGGEKDTVELFRIDLGESVLETKSICSYCIHDGDIERLLFVPSPFNILLSASADGKVVAFDPKSKEVVKEFCGHDDSVESLLFINMEKVNQLKSKEERINFLFQSDNELSKAIIEQQKKSGNVISVSIQRTEEIIYRVPIFISFLPPFSRKILLSECFRSSEDEKSYMSYHMDKEEEEELPIIYEYSKEFFDSSSGKPFDWFFTKCMFGVLSDSTMFGRKRDLERVVDLYRFLKKLRLIEHMYFICTRILNGFLDDEKLIVLFSLALVKLEVSKKKKKFISREEEEEEDVLTDTRIRFESGLTLVCFNCLQERMIQIVHNEKMTEILEQLNFLSNLKHRTAQKDILKHSDFSHPHMMKNNVEEEVFFPKKLLESPSQQTLESIFHDRLKNLYETKKYANISLVVVRKKEEEEEEEEKTIIEAHVEVLISGSNFFFQILKFPGNEQCQYIRGRKLEISQLDFGCLSCYVEFLYMNSININRILLGSARREEEEEEEKFSRIVHVAFKLLKFSDMYFEYGLKRYLLDETIPDLLDQVYKDNMLEVEILRNGYLLMKCSEKIREIELLERWEMRYKVKAGVFRQLIFESVRLRKRDKYMGELKQMLFLQKTKNQ